MERPDRQHAQRRPVHSARTYRDDFPAGARGGSNWGSGSVNPSKGLMYLTTQDWPTIYKLSLEDPLSARASSRAQSGRAIYGERCQACHGVNGVHSGGGPPQLAGINTRMALDSFGLVVGSGRGEMPAFRDLDESALRAVFEYLGTSLGSGGGARPQTVTSSTAGPVVASGGAPGGLAIQPSTGKRYSP